MNSSPITLALTLGDPTGIGPEVALKALATVLAEEESTRYVLVGDRGLIDRLGGVPGFSGGVPDHDADSGRAGRVSLASPTVTLSPQITAGHPSGATAAVQWLQFAGEGCLQGDFAGVVTGPVNKEAILNAGHPFMGQTEYLAALAGVRRFAMLLLGRDERERWLRVVLATTHLPLREVPDALNEVCLRNAIELGGEACGLLGLPGARIGVCGLNPHAGEGGYLGREELELIAPVVAAARTAGLDVRGPFAADTLFHQALHGAYELVVAMYHDQGLAPLKLVAFHTGVNWTLGLPFVRTSPDHGTAYDLAGLNQADPRSMIEALRLARQLALPNS